MQKLDKDLDKKKMGLKINTIVVISIPKATAIHFETLNGIKTVFEERYVAVQLSLL